MNGIKNMLPVILKVPSNPYVIGTAIVVFLYMDFCIFVANYKKRPKKAKKKSAPKPVPAKPAETGENGGEAKEHDEQSEHEEENA